MQMWVLNSEKTTVLLCTFLAKVKYTTETVRQRNFFETAQRISWNVLVMKDILTSVDTHLIQLGFSPLELCLFLDNSECITETVGRRNTTEFRLTL